MATAPLSARKYAKRGLCKHPSLPYFSKTGRCPNVRIACSSCMDIALCVHCSAAAKFGFTVQEVVLLRLLCDGHDGPELCMALNIGHQTARRHFTNMFDKTGTSHRVALAMRAVREGWVKVEIKVLVAEELAFAGLS